MVKIKNNHPILITKMKKIPRQNKKGITVISFSQAIVTISSKEEMVKIRINPNMDLHKDNQDFHQTFRIVNGSRNIMKAAVLPGIKIIKIIKIYLVDEISFLRIGRAA